MFETKLTSYFNGGNDLFGNERGGTVQAATDPTTSEHSSFVNLERFETRVSSPCRTGAGNFVQHLQHRRRQGPQIHRLGKSTLGVDAFLGGPGSISDTFTINGDVSGKTVVKVDSTNPGPGVFNKVGIPVVYVNGNVKGDEFFLNKPIDTGFFDYDLFDGRREAAYSSSRAFRRRGLLRCRN